MLFCFTALREFVKTDVRALGPFRIGSHDFSDALPLHPSTRQVTYRQSSRHQQTARGLILVGVRED